MSESIDLILLIAICIVMLAIHIIAYAHIHFGENGDEQISLATFQYLLSSFRLAHLLTDAGIPCDTFKQGDLSKDELSEKMKADTER